MGDSQQLTVFVNRSVWTLLKGAGSLERVAWSMLHASMYMLKDNLTKSLGGTLSPEGWNTWKGR